MQATTESVPTPAPQGEQSTRLAGRWLFKMLAVSIGFIGLGIWGLADALVIYPKRGAVAAEAFEHQYLSQLQVTGTLTNDSATIADPAGTLDRLRVKSKELAGSGTGLAALEKARLDWLTQLKLISKLTPTNPSFPRDDFRMGDTGSPTRVASAPERYEELKTKWTAGADGKAPKSQPLEWYDLPVQWLFVIVGGLIGPWMIFSVLRAKSKVYKYDAATKRLTLPGGQSITPADITDVDKSKWDKFYITFAIANTHPQLGGQKVTLDLYHHVPLEEWALELEAASKPA
jgi:hypothetical protein